MKKLISKAQAFAMAMLLPLTLTLGSCIDNNSFFTASEDDDPRILNTDIPDGENGNPGSVSANYDEPFHFEVIVTPADYTTVTWYENDQEVFVGKTIDKEFSIGDHALKIVAKTTKDKETFRYMNLTINGATLSNDMGARWLYPGAEVSIPGNAISRITKVLINNAEVENVKVADGMLSFKAPELPNGEYEIAMIDKDNNTFVDDNVTISTVTTPTINEASAKCKKGDAVEFTGIFLNKVKSIKVNGLEVEILYQEFGKIGFTCPLLPIGEYPVTAIAVDGSAVPFADGENGTLIVKGEEKPAEGGAEATLWTGTHVMPDWTPVDIWNDKVNSLISDGRITVDTKIRIYITRTATDYCSIAPINKDWASLVNGKNDPDRADLSAEMETEYVEFTVTETSMSVIKNGGFYLAGHGYTVNKITYTTPSVVVWEGNKEMPDWTPVDLCSAKVKDMVNVGQIIPGSKLIIFAERTATDYCSIAPINESWVSVVNGKSDPDRADMSLEVGAESVSANLNEAGVEAIKASGFFLAGHGYTVKKIVIE
ncbi:MAG: hypothetical protein KBT39_09150 [Bacteroidales bacterium]|nr:hypothetical protein [Bacteroidales bacterium]